MSATPAYLDLIHYRDPAIGVSEAARSLEETIRTIMQSQDSIFLNWRYLLKNEVRNLAAECVNYGWDGDDATPISDLASTTAEHFIDLLPENIHLPTIVPENTGEFLFNWDLGLNMTFNVIIANDYAIYAGILGDEKPYGEARIYNEMPSLIHTILVNYFRK